MNKQLHSQFDEEQIEFGEISSSLGFLLRIAQVQVFTAFFENLSQHGLKPGEFTVLWVIGLNPGLKQGTIARSLRIKPAHMTKLVQRAVDAGYIERFVPDEDRRSVRLFLTEQGKKFVSTKKPEFLNFIAKEHSNLDHEEFDLLIGLLRKFNGMEDAE